MSVSTTLQQMIIILLLMMVGFVCRKKNVIDSENSKCLSKIVVNVCNPALIVSSMLGSKGGDQNTIWITFAVAALLFAITIVISMILSRLLSKDKIGCVIYQLMFVFSNMGFIGIPVIRALFGSQYLIYVAIFIFEYNVLLYTYGYALLKTTNKGTHEKFSIKNLKLLLNMGTLACVVAIVLFLSGIKLPQVLNSTINYLGDAAVPLSMMIIGISIAEQENMLHIFSNVKQYIFAILKLIIVPAIEIVLIKRLPIPEDICEVYALLLAMPVGTMPLMLITQKGIDGKECSDGIILTTLLSIVTIPFIVFLYRFL